MLGKKGREAMLYGLNAFLAATADRIQPAGSRLREFPPVFIIGSPRCGSTLIYQILTNCLDIACPTNRLANFYGAPGLAIKLGFLNAGEGDSDFKSVFGKTLGHSGPSEFTKWWYRFFPKDPVYTRYSGMSDQARNGFRRSVENIAHACQKPMLFKNLYAVARLDAIINILPEALFVVISRSHLEISHSLLEARNITFGDYSTWFSLPLRDMETVRNLAPAEQVFLQVKGIYREIDQTLKENRVSQDRILHLRYEDFCHDPAAGITAFREFVATRGIHLKTISTPPESFVIRTNIRIDQEIYLQLKKLCHEDKSAESQWTI